MVVGGDGGRNALPWMPCGGSVAGIGGRGEERLAASSANGSLVCVGELRCCWVRLVMGASAAVGEEEGPKFSNVPVCMEGGGGIGGMCGCLEGPEGADSRSARSISDPCCCVRDAIVCVVSKRSNRPSPPPPPLLPPPPPAVMGGAGGAGLSEKGLSSTPTRLAAAAVAAGGGGGLDAADGVVVGPLSSNDSKLVVTSLLSLPPRAWLTAFSFSEARL
mmetsp:Transcript_20212/g.57805  ORF Transcript_20212/g.57805 Transcript_20212/m.57805 type:complete len:218 (-) Transcript_20212:1838-2491(-)